MIQERRDTESPTSLGYTASKRLTDRQRHRDRQTDRQINRQRHTERVSSWILKIRQPYRVTSGQRERRWRDRKGRERERGMRDTKEREREMGLGEG